MTLRLHPFTALTAAACTAVITTAAAIWPLSVAVGLAAAVLAVRRGVAGRLDRIRQAQETRGMVIRGGLWSRAGALRLQMIPLVLALMDDAGNRAQALEARGFGSPGPRTSYRDVADPPAQRLFRAAACVLAAAAVAARLVVSWPAGWPS
jgi:energy-coupling factor transport system permease protein